MFVGMMILRFLFCIGMLIRVASVVSFRSRGIVLWVYIHSYTYIFPFPLDANKTKVFHGISAKFTMIFHRGFEKLTTMKVWTLSSAEKPNATNHT